jgi:integrase
MSRRRSSELIACPHYAWLLSRRAGVWSADGRTNPVNLGRHSLGTRDEAKARLRLAELDRRVAVARGRAVEAPRPPEVPNELSLGEGRRLYLAHVARPTVAGGARSGTLKRYRAVFDKFDAFCASRRVATWNAVTDDVIQNYLSHLGQEEYAYRTQYLEGTTIKQALGWFVETKRLPESARSRLTLRKPTETHTHCWTPAEFRAIVGHCRARADLHWLADVVVGLGTTGLRISELAALRWDDLDTKNEVLHLKDESTRAGQAGRTEDVRTTKGKRSRSLPIAPELRTVLESRTREPGRAVFRGPKGGRLKPDTVRNIFVREVLTPLAATPGLSTGFADGRLHSFRHYFCSMSANRGVPQRTLMRWLGHRESDMVEHYYHLHDDESRRQMMKLDHGLPAGALPAGV